jgi:hypothetical protein
MQQTTNIPIEQQLREKRTEILAIAARHGAVNLRLFGSAARGEARPESDVDLLIDVREPVSPWFPGGLIADLEELLGRRVDVVEEAALRPRLRPYIIRDAVPL